MSDHSTSNKDVEKLEPKTSRDVVSEELGPVTTRAAEVVAKDPQEHEILQEKMRLEDANNDIQYKTCSWQKTAILLFAEYVCLAILSFAWSFYYLGYGPALVINIGIGILTYYTSYTLWQYCMLYPAMRDICDIGYILFGNSPVARELTALGLLLNNIFIMGLHVLTGSKILNTDSNHAICTTGFVLIFLVICIIASLPRTLSHVSYMGIVSAILMGFSILLTLIFAGIEDHPSTGPAGDFPAGGPVTSMGGPAKGVTFVEAFNAVLNITFTWIGQICYPTFIAEMKDPRDFPKALKLLTVMEMIVFSVFGVVGYRYLGQYSGAPAVLSLSPTYKKIAFTFALVPTIVIGVIYANIVIKYMYFRLMGNSRHAHSNTVIGWGVWVLLTIVAWVIGMIVAEAIPSFGDLLSLMSALFDAWFGWIFWAVAYYRMNKHQLWKGPKKSAETVLNIFIAAMGLMMFGPGTYTSVKAIIADYTSGQRPFQCANNAG